MRVYLYQGSLHMSKRRARCWVGTAVVDVVAAARVPSLSWQAARTHKKTKVTTKNIRSTRTGWKGSFNYAQTVGSATNDDDDEKKKKKGSKV